MTMMDENADTKVDVKPDSSSVLDRREERRQRRWYPFEMLDELQEEMARLWGSTFPLMPRPLSRPLRRMSLAPTNWMPSVDVYEKGGNLVVKAELPGIKKDDIEVTLDRGDLVIRGERKAESETREDHYYRMERSYGTFYRRIPLPAEVKPEQITASYHDGLLEVRIARPTQEQQSRPQRIPLR
jgi:HSP20 family protein